MATMSSAIGQLGNFPSSSDLRDVDVDDAMLNSYLFDFGKSMSATAMMNGSDTQARLAALMATPAGDPNAVDFAIPEHEPVQEQTVQPMFSGLMSRFTPNNFSNNISSILPERLSKRNAREAVRAVAAQEQPSTSPALPSNVSASHSDDDSDKPSKGRGRRSKGNPKDPQKLAALQEKNRRAQRRWVFGGAVCVCGGGWKHTHMLLLSYTRM